MPPAFILSSSDVFFSFSQFLAGGLESVCWERYFHEFEMALSSQEYIFHIEDFQEGVMKTT